MILVTGGTGCVGSHVTRALVGEGEQVRLLVRPDEDLDAGAPVDDLLPSVELHRGDVRDAAAIDRAVRGARAVLHLAGVAGLSTGLGRLMHEVNATGTAIVAGAALRHGARMVLTSSASAVGLPPAGVTADEDFDFTSTPVTHPYPLSKRAGEHAALALVGAGLDLVVLNPGAVLATGGDPRSTWSGLVGRVAAGRFPVAPPGGFPFLGRVDVVAAHLAALERGATGRRYLVVGEHLRYADLLSMVADAAGVPGPRYTAPTWMLRGGAAAAVPIAALVRDPLRQPLLLPSTLPFLVQDLRYDGSRAVRELGLRPRPVAEAVDELVTAAGRPSGTDIRRTT